MSKQVSELPLNTVPTPEDYVLGASVTDPNRITRSLIAALPGEASMALDAPDPSAIGYFFGAALEVPGVILRVPLESLQQSSPLIFYVDGNSADIVGINFLGFQATIENGILMLTIPEQSGGGGSASGIDIYNESTLVKQNASKINLTGGVIVSETTEDVTVEIIGINIFADGVYVNPFFNLNFLGEGVANQNNNQIDISIPSPSEIDSIKQRLSVIETQLGI